MTPETQPSAATRDPERSQALIQFGTRCGLTIIIGGTNVRFCISTPRQRDVITEKVTWSDLEEQLKPELERQLLDFKDSKNLALDAIAGHLVDFIASRFEQGRGSPLSGLCSINFSSAGPVSGIGSCATITTINTGITLEQEPIARSFIGALNRACQVRGWDQIDTGSLTVGVLNDAAAGLLGEVLEGGLREIETGFFLIVGTGVGGLALVEGTPCSDYNEPGHRLILDMSSGEYRFLSNQELAEHQDETGSFTQPKEPLTYAENQLAGPWAALNFMRYLRADEKKAYYALAKEVATELKQGESHVIEEMTRLLDLDYSQITKWAKESPSDIIRCVNKVLFNPNLSRLNNLTWNDVDPATECEREPSEQLELLAALRWELYCRDLGEFLGALHKKMSSDGHTPKKIVIGGGIGELFNSYPDSTKALALDLIHEKAGIPLEAVAFSALDPVRREAAMTQACVDSSD